MIDLNKTISSDLGTDIGGLKAILLARGDHRANYSDAVGDNYNNVSQSVLMNIQAEFDQLIHNTVVSVNDVFAEAAGVKEVTGVNADGETVTVRAIAANPGGYMCDEEGIPYQLFTKIAGDGYSKQTLTVTDENGVTTTGDYWVYNEENLDALYSQYSLANTQINQKLMQEPASFGFRLDDGSEDLATMEKLKEVFTSEKYTLNPNVLKRVSIIDYYDDLVSQVANSAYVYNTIYENQQTTVEAALSARDQVTAVSSDEELSNMIKFQNAYNASSRFINVVNDMLEQLLNSLA